MVKEINGKYYVCPICSTIYADEDDAKECIIECSKSRLEDPIIKTRSGFECEICKAVHIKKEWAEMCEQKHEMMSDDHYMKWKTANMLKLASHPEQKKLDKFGKPVTQSNKKLPSNKKDSSRKKRK